MNFKNIRALALFTFIFVSSESFAQCKYDIGVKVSSYEMERFQFEGRLHLNNPYTLVLNYSYGSKSRSGGSQTPVYNDSLTDVKRKYFFAHGHTIKLGLQRKLGFLATDVFYVGASLGVGIENHTFARYSKTYTVQDSSHVSSYLIGYDPDNNSNFTTTHGRSINTQIALSFGMDIPLTKRLSLNAEIGVANIYEKSSSYPTVTMDFYPSVSGGLRYQFGKREKT